MIKTDIKASEYVEQEVIPKIQEASHFLSNNNLKEGYGRYCKKKDGSYELCVMGALILNDKVLSVSAELVDILSSMLHLDVSDSYTDSWEKMGFKNIFIKLPDSKYPSHIATKIVIWNDGADSDSSGSETVIQQLSDLIEDSPEVFHFQFE